MAQQSMHGRGLGTAHPVPYAPEPTPNKKVEKQEESESQAIAEPAGEDSY